MNMRSRITAIVGLSIALIVCCIGCSRKEDDPRPHIKRVSTESDVATALGMKLIKYEFDLKDLPVPRGKMLFQRVWSELKQGDERVQTWGDHGGTTCEEAGSILIAFYKPPLFENEGGTIIAKICVSSGPWSTEDIVAPDCPFTQMGHGTVFQEDTIELDREYILAVIAEPYSPDAKGAYADPDPQRSKTENKALIFKVKFFLKDG